MSWKTFIFFALTCAAANHSLWADEIVRSTDSPVIVRDAEYDRYEIRDKFLVKQGAQQGHIRSLETLFPQMNEVTPPQKERSPLVQRLIESTKKARQQTASKPKLTVVVESDNKNATLGDNLEPEEMAANELPDRAASDVKREKYRDFTDDEHFPAPEKTTRSSRHHYHHRYHQRDAHGHHHHQHHKHHQQHDITRKLRERWFSRFNLP